MTKGWHIDDDMCVKDAGRPSSKWPKRPDSHKPHTHTHTKPKQAAKPKEEPKPAQEAKPKDEPKPKEEAKPKEEPKPKEEAKPPAEKSGGTSDAKNNCPEKQVKACDVTLYRMKAIPRKQEDASDKGEENAKVLETDKQLRGKLSPQDAAKVKKYGKEYVKLLETYDLIIETKANYKTADSGPEETIDFEVETEWEGKCSAHPLIVMAPHSDMGDQDALLVPSTGKKEEMSAVDNLTYKLNSKDETQNQLRGGEASRFTPEKTTWPIGTKKVAVKNLTALGIIDDIVDAEEAGIFRTLLGIGGIVWALDKTVDIEIFADSDGEAETQRKPNKHLNGLLRIYRATEIGIEMSIPFGSKITQKKERGEATEARETEEPLNSAGKRKWELKLKVDNYEILLDGDESQDETAWKKGSEAAGKARDYAKDRWDNRATLGTDVANDVQGVRQNLNHGGTGAIQSARNEWGELQQNAGRLRTKAREGVRKSQNAANRAAQRYDDRMARQDATAGRAPKQYEKLIRGIVRAWKMLNAALRSQGGIAKQFIKLLKKWPKFGFFFDFELSFCNVTLSATLERIPRPGDPLLGRLIPIIGNTKFAVEGVLFEAKVKVGFGVDFEFSSNVHIEVALEGEGDGKVPVKLEASPFDDSTFKTEGELNLKLAAVAQVKVLSFTMDARVELATGIRPEGEIKWVADERKLTGEIKLRTIPLTLSGSFTEPGFGTKSEVASITLVEPKLLYSEEIFSKVIK